MNKEGTPIVFYLKKIFVQYLLGNWGNCFILTIVKKTIKKVLDSKTDLGPIAVV